MANFYLKARTFRCLRSLEVDSRVLHLGQELMNKSRSYSMLKTVISRQYTSGQWYNSTVKLQEMDSTINRRCLFNFYGRQNCKHPTPSRVLNKSSSLSGIKYYSTNPEPHDKDNDCSNKPILKLMDSCEHIWPNPWKSFKNIYFAFLIRAYFDREFSMDNFLKGAVQAVQAVSNYISIGNFDALEGLVSREALREVRANYQHLDEDQRRYIAVDARDIFMKFVYEIGMIFDDNSDKKFVEITAVLQGFHGSSEEMEKTLDDYNQEMERAREKVYVCNYRFIRELKKDVDDEWMINKLNHFKPADIVDNTSLFKR